jgi:hypothetical protein
VAVGAPGVFVLGGVALVTLFVGGTFEMVLLGAAGAVGLIDGAVVAGGFVWVCVVTRLFAGVGVGLMGALVTLPTLFEVVGAVGSAQPGGIMAQPITEQNRDVLNGRFIRNYDSTSEPLN